MTSADRRIIKRAEEMDLRRQQQVQNQIASINRLMKGGTYDSEMQALQDRLADAHAALAAINTILGESARPDGQYAQDDGAALSALHEAVDSWYALRPDEYKAVIGRA